MVLWFPNFAASTVLATQHPYSRPEGRSRAGTHYWAAWQADRYSCGQWPGKYRWSARTSGRKPSPLPGLVDSASCDFLVYASRRAKPAPARSVFLVCCQATIRVGPRLLDAFVKFGAAHKRGSDHPTRPDRSRPCGPVNRPTSRYRRTGTAKRRRQSANTKRRPRNRRVCPW